MSTWIAVIQFTIQALLIYLTARIASAKNRSWVTWGIFAFFVPLIPLICIVFASKIRPEDEAPAFEGLSFSDQMSKAKPEKPR